jgi:DNA-binding LacI/PurR family transcriptional regulator
VVYINGRVPRPVRQFGDDDTILGYILIMNLSDVPDEDVIRDLLHFGKPVAVFDMVDGHRTHQLSRRANQLRYFISSVSRRNPAQVAQFLISRGHRRIAYISPFHGAAWSRMRCEVLKQAFADAGIENGVSLYCDEGLQSSVSSFRRSIKQYSSKHILDAYKSWLATAPPQFSSWKSQPAATDPVVRGLYNLHVASERFLQCSALFKQAAADKSITAWVCANDQVGEMAVDFCRDSRIAVPLDLWILGFDDTSTALMRRLTSFNFNHLGLIQSILNFILRPSSFAEMHKEQVVEIDGIITERETTGLRWH